MLHLRAVTLPTQSSTLLSLLLLVACESTPSAVPDTERDGMLPDGAPDASMPCLCGDDVYSWVVIDDFSVENDEASSPGTQICAVDIVCDGGPPISGLRAQVRLGIGQLCVGRGNGCSTSRVEPEAALGHVEDPCVIDSVPSDYVSTGYFGALAVQFNVPGRCGLTGCQVRIKGPVNATEDLFRVRVCSDPAGDVCGWTSALDELLGNEGIVHTLDCCVCGSGEGAP